MSGSLWMEIAMEKWRVTEHAELYRHLVRISAFNLNNVL